MAKVTRNRYPIHLGPDRRYYQRKRNTTENLFEFPWSKVNPTTGFSTSGIASFPMTKTMWDTPHHVRRSDAEFRAFLNSSESGVVGRKRNYASDWGHPMIQHDVGFTSVIVHGPSPTNSPGSAYRGLSYLTPPSSVNLAWLGPSFAPLDKTQLWQYGGKAISATRPNQPDFSLPTFIGELREGVPRAAGMSLLRDRVNLARRSGREYLNIEFGWKPLIDDLRAIGRTIRDSSQIRDSYVRGAATTQRRRWNFPREVSTGVVSTPTASWFGGNQYSSNGTASWSQTKSIWFSGRFRYFIPQGDEISARWERWNAYGDRLMGLSYHSIPETVWELAPWSWFVDWFVDVGSVINNIGLLGGDGVLLDYGYLMCEQVASTSVRLKVVNPAGDPRLSASHGFDYRDRWRQRGRASPYGFGLKDTDLSVRQLAIMAAIGIDRRWYAEN